MKQKKTNQELIVVNNQYAKCERGEWELTESNIEQLPQ